MLDNVSIIIPLADNETAHHNLITVLKDTNAEIILPSKGTRAKSLNAGAAKASRAFLWFLHADSSITTENISALDKASREHPSALHYFDLAFDDGGISKINAWGANLRSQLLGLPFGDQGLCIAKEHFTPYREDVPCAEDLHFVISAHKNDIKLKRIGSKLITSARKYREKGWLKLTCQYQIIWIEIYFKERFS